MFNRKQNESFGVTVALLSAFISLVIILLATLASVLFPAVEGYIIGMTATVLLLASQAGLIMVSRRRLNSEEFEKSKSFNLLMSDAVRSMEVPVIITMVDGRIVWANNAMLEVTGASARNALAGLPLSKYCDRPVAEIFSGTKPAGTEVKMCGRSFRALSYLMEKENCDYWMTVFTETTALKKAQAEILHEAPVIGFAVIDNARDVAQYAKNAYRTSAAEIESILRAWVEKLGGYICEYDRDKYMFVFPADRLQECMDDGFSVIDAARQAGSAAGNIPFTVSMGICDACFDITERGKCARDALETAIQRGGDQAVVRTLNDTVPFGGRTKVEQKRGRISSRTVCERLQTLVSEAGNVLIMGHKTPDFDSIGSCIGIARFAKRYNSSVKIVIDRKNSNYKLAVEKLFDTYPDYSDMFVDGATGQDMIRSDSLVIVCDVNNLKIVEAPEIIDNTDKLVIMDHHLKIKDFSADPEIAYIEPSASSCCELVSEILQLSEIGSAAPEEGGLLREEADVMLAGIMLDTRNFTRSSTESTFAAAMFLRKSGASPENAESLFDDDFSGFVNESKLGSNVRLYRDCVAVTVLDIDGEITTEDRVSASRTAEALLKVKQVSAAFALLKSPDTVLISARSDGSINVQLILEKLGGGGRFDAAGAQVGGKSARIVIEDLKAAIDSFLDSENE